MDSTRSQYVFLQSKNRHSGTPAAATYVLQGHAALCRKGETMQVALRSATIPWTWLQLRTGINDAFLLLRVGNGEQFTITLEPGTYSFKQLATAASLKMSAATGDECRCVYDPTDSKFIFTFAAEPMFILWQPGGLSEFFGFAQLDLAEGSRFESFQTAKPGSPDHFLLQVTNVSPASFNIDNSTNAPEGARLSSVLAVVPVAPATPNGVITFDDAVCSYTMDLNDQFLERLTLTWLQPDGTQADYIPDHQLALLITFKRDSDVEILLRSIDETLKMQLMNQTF